MPLDCNEIIPGHLWVGAFVAVPDVGELRELGITTVLSLQTPEDLPLCGTSERTLSRAFKAAAIDFRQAPVRDFDRQSLADRLAHCVRELQDALASEDARVYLHCTAGVNRSPTVAAALLMRTRGMTAKDAYEFVRARRSCSPCFAVLEEFTPPLPQNPANSNPGL